uniref:beta-N-acetylhexosaminidase n=1 Tax=Malurus cyaneus samueli TaxID=2593467 RepID=A0A8C5UMC2_9PASS
PRDVSATEMRLVHLDLKGAAPRVSYLEQVFPLLSQLGANGVLIEYEDMFPFKGELEILRSPYSRSPSQITEIPPGNPPENPPDGSSPQFILKHEKYQHLREVERFPNSFNPHIPDTLALLKSILSQVIEKHRRSTWIHIGADEVFHLGEGMDSKNWMSHNKGDVGTMFLKHIKEVLGFLTAQYWGLRVLMWDDMLRKISVGALRESGIAKHVSPVVWFYAADFEAEQIGKVTLPFLTKYVESGFEAVWFASAFKGTTGPAQAWTPLSYHLKNHLSWLKVMQAVPRLAPLRLQGIVLTGWQRYDHYSVLCELLPVSIPSLAICLQTLVNGETPGQAHPVLLGRALGGGGRQRRNSLSSPSSDGEVAQALLSLPRGLHRRGKEEGPGCAGLGECAAGAEHLVRGTCLWHLHWREAGPWSPKCPDPRVLGFTQPSAPCVLGPHLPLPFPSEGRGAFPGVEIYHMVEQVNGHLKESILKTLEEER